MRVIETLLVFAVAALHLAVVPRCVRADQLMSNASAGQRCFKQGRDIALAVGETVGKLKAVVCLNALDLNPSPLIPKDGSLGKIGG